jgi:hypothetical protein
MIIRDLEVLEIVAQDETVEGGIAWAGANASAYAYGATFSATQTGTVTGAVSYSFFFYN